MSNILIADQIDPIGITLLKGEGYTVDARFTISPQEIVSAIGQYDALIVRGRTKVTREVIEKGTKLKVIARAGTGVDTIDMDAARARKLIVVNAQGANAEAVAEHTLAFILMLARNMFDITLSTRQGKWEKKTYEAMELEGKTLGVVGLGTIGYRVAQFGRTLGMAVVAYSRTTNGPKSLQIETLGGRFVELSELLEMSDVVSLHVPLTTETKGLIRDRELSMMKPTAYLVNTSRGEVVDEGALVDHLKNKKIAGAALDVFASEPLPGDHPFLTIPNMVLTPHVASVSQEGASRISRMIAEDVVRVLSGKEARHMVV